MTDTHELEKKQIVMCHENAVASLVDTLKGNGVTNILVVCGRTCSRLPVFEEFSRMGMAYTLFSDFAPNPDIDSAVKGIEVFRSNGCDCIMAIGGGSAMDVAKCIKLYIDADLTKPLVEQAASARDIILAAVPTTAGTGSEATRYSVVYYKGNKQSVTHTGIIPDYVVLDGSLLNSLPDYQRKVTMLDALMHSIESYWSVNSCDYSKEYSRTALKMIFDNMQAYLDNTAEGNEQMLLASNWAGKAINITQTTAGHAMSYKLTSMYGLAHGHAAAICVVSLWRFMAANLDKCVDSRGRDYLEKTFNEIAECMGADSVEEAVDRLQSLLEALDIKAPQLNSGDELDELVASVNLTRLKNNPVGLESEDLRQIYSHIFGI